MESKHEENDPAIYGHIRRRTVQVVIVVHIKNGFSKE